MKGISSFVFTATCVLAVVDTHLFVYPSLSRSISLEIGVSLLTLLFSCKVVMKRCVIVITKFELFLMAWIVFVVLHGLYMPLCEQYRTIYLCLTLFLPILLANMQRTCLLTIHTIETVLLVIACIHIIYIVGQGTGLIESGSKYFHVTGCNENPTVTALCLVGCLPIMMKRIVTSKRKIVYVPFFLTAIYGILILHCRTAYIGVSVELATIVLLRYDTKSLLARRPLLVGLFGIVLLSSIVFASVALYNMKRDSADGRRLIWKLAAKMIVEKPSGYGYGLFEKSYNLRQAEYFSCGEYNNTEARHANFVYMPYNDYLEHGIEGGVVGMSFLVSFYAVMIRKALQLKRKEYAAVFISFAIMSLFNFVYVSIFPWVLLMCFSSFVICEMRNTTLNFFFWKIKRNETNILPNLLSGRYTQMMLISLVCFVSFRIWKMAEAQIILKRLTTVPTFVNDMEYAKIEKAIGTSEAYWTMRTINSLKDCRFEEAMKSILKARSYSSEPKIFMVEQYCLRKMGKMEESIRCRDTLSYMAPVKIRTNKVAN